MTKRSAGIVLFQVRQRQPRVLLVHPGGPFWKRKDVGAWSIPKGEYTDDEDPRTAALREFYEETGTELADDALLDLGQIKQTSGKEVLAWAVEGDFDVSELRSNVFDMEWPPRSGKTQQFPEVDRAQWFDPDTAREKINAAQRELVDRLIATLRDQGRIDSPQ